MMKRDKILRALIAALVSGVVVFCLVLLTTPDENAQVLSLTSAPAAPCGYFCQGKNWINKHPAVSGAIAGGVAGSTIFPGVGTVIGIVTGATVGHTIGDDERASQKAEEGK